MVKHLDLPSNPTMVLFKGCNLLCKKRCHGTTSKQAGKAAVIADGLMVSDSLTNHSRVALRKAATEKWWKSLNPPIFNQMSPFDFFVTLGVMSSLPRQNGTYDLPSSWWSWRIQQLEDNQANQVAQRTAVYSRSTGPGDINGDTTLKTSWKSTIWLWLT